MFAIAQPRRDKHVTKKRIVCAIGDAFSCSVVSKIAIFIDFQKL